jgi:ubiquinone/menaquinone biosynthesis C-methylase UbiE
VAERVNSAHDARPSPFLENSNVRQYDGKSTMGKATFDSIASFYPLLEQTVFGSTLSQARRIFITQVRAGNHILLIGEGNGRFLFEALTQTSADSFTVVDSSARMLAATTRRIATVDRCPHVELIQADILEWRSPAASYDRVVTHFFLDQFRPERIRRIVEKISRLATEDALWINVDFTSENQNLRQKFLMWVQYRFFRIFAGIESARLFDPGPWIRKAGWDILETKSLDSGWISAELMSRQLSPPSSGVQTSPDPP